MTSYGMNTQEGGSMCQVLDECAQTLATTHRGGGSRLYALDGDKWKERPEYRKRQGGNGFGLSEEGVMYTLTTVDRHIVALCAVEDSDER